MSDRLTELKRQRVLIQAHLTWLDQEIAAAGGSSPSSSAPSVSHRPRAEPMSSVEADHEADELIAKFRDEAPNPAQGARKGCFYFFALAFVLLGLGVYGFYLYTLSRL